MLFIPDHANFFGPSYFVKPLLFTRAGEFNADKECLPLTILLGFYEEEWNAYKEALENNDIISRQAFDEEIRGRTRAQYLSLQDPRTPSPTAIILRHLDSKSAYTTIRDSPVSAILATVACMNSVLDVEIADLDLPTHFVSNWDADIPLTRLLRSDILSSLTLLRVVLPWSAFAFFPALDSLDVENVALEGPMHNLDNQRASYPHRRELKALRWSNSTQLIRRLVFSDGAHGLAFNGLEALECDMGSEESAECANALMERSERTLQSLGFDFEANGDTPFNLDLLSNDVAMAGLYLPKLRLLRLSDIYHMGEFYSLSNVLAVLHWTHQPGGGEITCPALSEVAVIVKKLPVFQSYIYTSYPDWILDAIQTIMKMRFQELDDRLYAFREKSQGHTVFSLELTLDDVNAREATPAREMLEIGGDEPFKELEKYLESNPWDKGEFAALMDKLNTVPTDSASWSDAEKSSIEHDFLRFFLGKVWTLKNYGMAQVRVELTPHEEDFGCGGGVP